MRRILAVSTLFAIVSTASAQTPVTPGWSAFSGCWVPIPADNRAPSATDPRVCVVPDGANSADLVSVVGEKTTERTRVIADGQKHDVSKQGCSGWESAAFSSDGRRLYLTSEQSCLGGTKRKTSGLFAIAPNGDWINAMNVAADSANSLRVSRYSPATLSSAIPADIRTVLEAREMSDRTAHISASRSSVSTAAIIEATKFVAAPSVEAWITELEYDFNLTDKELIRLADAGVPPSVLDVMIAVSNPRVFDVRATGSGYAASPSDSLMARREHVYRGSECTTPVLDPWGYYAYDPCDPYHRYSYYQPRWSRYGYDPYSRYGSYDPYGYGYNGYYDRPLIIVVRGADLPKRPHGRMTNDGYTSGTASTTGTATTSTTSTRRAPLPTDDGGRTATRTSGSSGSSGSGSSSSGSSSSGSSSSTGSSSSGGDGGRTATRKPPAA